MYPQTAIMDNLVMAFVKLQASAKLAPKEAPDNLLHIA